VNRAHCCNCQTHCQRWHLAAAPEQRCSLLLHAAHHLGSSQPSTKAYLLADCQRPWTLNWAEPTLQILVGVCTRILMHDDDCMHKRLYSQHDCIVIDLLVKHSCNASNASCARQPSSCARDRVTESLCCNEACARTQEGALYDPAGLGATSVRQECHVSICLGRRCFLPPFSTFRDINLGTAGNNSGSQCRHTDPAACVRIVMVRCSISSPSGERTKKQCQRLLQTQHLAAAQHG
jgi:hypothetical protein